MTRINDSIYRATKPPSIIPDSFPTIRTSITLASASSTTPSSTPLTRVIISVVVNSEVTV